MKEGSDQNASIGHWKESFKKEEPNQHQTEACASSAVANGSYLALTEGIT